MISTAVYHVCGCVDHVKVSHHTNIERGNIKLIIEQLLIKGLLEKL